MAQIFITGATGFVGRHLLPALIQTEHTLRCLVRTTANAERLRRLGCHVSVGDLLQPKTWEAALASTDTVIHLAVAHRGAPQLLQRINAEGATKLIAAAERAGARKFLYLSTLTASAKPQWPYAYSTWLAEQALQQSSLNYTILRCSIIIGRGDLFLEGIIKMARYWPIVPIIGSGQTKFQLLDVRDVVRCLLQAISTERHSQKLLSIGGPEALSYEEIVDSVLSALHLQKRKIRLPRRFTRWLVRELERFGVRTPFAPGHFLSRDHCAHSVRAIEENFGFVPTAFHEGLQAALSESFA